MIKALLFDFDGLIMDTETPEVDVWKEVYAEHGQEFPLQIWLSEVVGSTEDNFDAGSHLAGLTGQTLDLPALRTRVRDHRLKTLSTLSALPGVTDYLVTARRLGLRLAVASSSPHEWVEKYLGQLGLLKAFDVLICREDAQFVKPHPALFLKALEVLDLKPGEALVFEDSPNGVLAARRAGIRVVAIPNPITKHAVSEGPNLVLNSLAELPLKDLLKRFEPEIRQETPTDIPGIRMVEEKAFARATEADLVDLCRKRDKVSLSLVAANGHGITGHILFTPVTLEPLRDGLRGLGLGPIAVLPESQQTGIGSRLMQAGLEICRERGYDFVVLLGDPRYYSRFGFIPARDLGLSSDYGDGDEFQVLELASGALAGASGQVKYLPEFSEMDC